MRIAVASEGLEVSPLFGHCTSFTCYKVTCGVIVECQNMPNPHLPASRLASLLGDLDVSTLIAGAIERDAAETLQQAGIDVVPNQAGTVRGAAETYLARTLTGIDDADEEDVEVMEA